MLSPGTQAISASSLTDAAENGLLQSASECSEGKSVCCRRAGYEPAYAWQSRRRLRARCDRPRHSRAAEQRHELPPPHSITSSARASRILGIARPSALAALRLTTSSNFVGA